MSQSDRAAKFVEEGGRAFEAGELIKAKLNRAIKALSDTSEFAKANGRLSPDEQHAVRVLRSRQRMIDREWLACFGNGKDKVNAMAELRLPKPDNGMLFRLGEKMHAQGRLHCLACATTMEEGTPFPVSLARLCPKCNNGIEHVYDTQEIPPGVQGAGDPQATLPDGGLPPLSVVVTRHFYCDNCSNTEEVIL